MAKLKIVNIFYYENPGPESPGMIALQSCCKVRRTKKIGARSIGQHFSWPERYAQIGFSLKRLVN